MRCSTSCIPAVVPGGKSNDLAILRYTSAGVIDSSFGNNGVTTFSNAQGKGIAIKTTGEIVVTGWFNNGSEYDMALWQFVP